MDYTTTRRNNTKPRGGTASSPSPSLPRSKSGSHDAMCKIYPFTSSQRFDNTDRSKSTTKSRSSQSSENGGSSVNKLLPRGATSPRNNSGRKGSAWALSPGRSGSSPVVAPISGGAVKVKTSGSRGAMNGVLKYFRPKKKASSAEEEEKHRYRIANSRLVQWRFVNATASASMAAKTTLAQERILFVWIMIWKMRESIGNKKKMVEKLKHEIKVYQILNPQIRLLNEWAKLEKKNCESVGRVTRKLCGISVRLPLDDAKGDEESVIKAMKEAVEVMGGIEQVAKQFLYQVEKMLYLLTELTITIKVEEECMEELHKHVPLLATSVIKEGTLRAHLLQVTKD